MKLLESYIIIHLYYFFSLKQVAYTSYFFCTCFITACTRDPMKTHDKRIFDFPTFFPIIFILFYFRLYIHQVPCLLFVHSIL